MTLPFILLKPLLKGYSAWHDFSSLNNLVYLYSCPSTWPQINCTRCPWEGGCPRATLCPWGNSGEAHLGLCSLSYFTSAAWPAALTEPLVPAQCTHPLTWHRKSQPDFVSSHLGDQGVSPALAFLPPQCLLLWGPAAWNFSNCEGMEKLSGELSFPVCWRSQSGQVAHCCGKDSCILLLPLGHTAAFLPAPSHWLIHDATTHGMEWLQTTPHAPGKINIPVALSPCNCTVSGYSARRWKKHKGESGDSKTAHKGLLVLLNTSWTFAFLWFMHLGKSSPGASFPKVISDRE